MSEHSLSLLSADVRDLERIRQRMVAALTGAIAVWDKHYQDMPPSAEEDEFGPMLEARSALQEALRWTLLTRTDSATNGERG